MKCTAVLAALVATAAAIGDSRSFAVLRFYGDGALTECRLDPIVQPGGPSGHVHTVMGGSGFGPSSTGEDLMNSECSNALVVGDNSNYWYPKLYFHDKGNNSFEPVELFYMNVYYFFEASDDPIKAFPVGLQMVSGNAMTRVSPGTGDLNLDPSKGTIQPVQWTCPRSNTNVPLYPAGADGSISGIGDANNKGAGTGLPFQECDGYASPLRMDIHFPSCYNPAAGLTNFQSNMQFPTSAKGGKQNCPEGWIHTPHIFYEVYWNTPKFVDRWTPGGDSQPFLLSEGDLTGFSEHGDFMAAWDEDILQHIIDTCDEGDSGMDKCAGVQVRDKKQECHITCPVNEQITGSLAALPGNNPLAGWGIGNTTPSMGGSSSSAVASSPSSAASPAKSSTSAAVKVQVSSSSLKAEPSTSAEEQSTSTEDPVAVTNVEKDPNPTTTVTQKADPTPATNTEAPALTQTPIIAQKPTSLPDVGKISVSTVWDTETVWRTVYVTEDGTPTATAIPVPTTIAVLQPSSGLNATSSSNSSLPDVAGWKYAGCFKDTSSRVITGDRLPILGAMSNDKCVTYCQSKGFSLAGTEYGGQCFCGNDIVGSAELDEATCSMPCEGDAAATCGGHWALTLYSADGTVKTGTGAAAAAKRHVHYHALHHRRMSYNRR